MNSNERGLELLASLQSQSSTMYNVGDLLDDNQVIAVLGRLQDTAAELIRDRRTRAAAAEMRAREEAERIAYISETGISEPGMRAREEERIRLTLRIAQAEAEAEAALALTLINPHPWITIRRPRQPALTFKMKVVKKALLDLPVQEECPICYEKPFKKDSIETACGHTYCHDCFNTHANNSPNGIKCPMCRAECKQITGFKQRASRSQEIPVLDLTEEEPLWTSFLA